MCAFVRWWRQLCASFRAGTSSKQKWARFWLVREKKVWKELPALWSTISAIQTREQQWHEPSVLQGGMSFHGGYSYPESPLNVQGSSAGK